MAKLIDLLSETKYIKTNAAFGPWVKAHYCKGLDLAVCKENLLLFKDVMDDCRIPFFLAFGTLLGAMRENDFIDSDHDTDVIVSPPDEERLVETVNSGRIQAIGFRVIRLMPDLVTFGRREEYLDVYIFRPGEDAEYDWCMHYYKLEKNQIAQSSTISFLGRNFLTVRDPKAYLDARYGNWHIKSDCTTKF